MQLPTIFLHSNWGFSLSYFLIRSKSIFFVFTTHKMTRLIAFSFALVLVLICLSQGLEARKLLTSMGKNKGSSQEPSLVLLLSSLRKGSILPSSPSDEKLFKHQNGNDIRIHRRSMESVPSPGVGN